MVNAWSVPEKLFNKINSLCETVLFRIGQAAKMTGQIFPLFKIWQLFINSNGDRTRG
jgi:hypothetical protein